MVFSFISSIPAPFCLLFCLHNPIIEVSAYLR
nr:MAG TPA: hypothetical protein [Caudoviricetes sp.]DAY90290.1 MAG TPA: hypothetical protein [Caudoviricetes sp.]